MSRVYKWKSRAQVPVGAQAAGERLEQLAEGKGGALLPAAVVKDALPKRSLLHPCFEWDDSVAAEAHRKSQANYLLRNILTIETIPDTEEEREIRAFVIVEEDDSQHYTSIGRAISNDELRDQILERALGELNSWQKRYDDLVEFVQIFAAIQTVRLAQAAKKKPVRKKKSVRRRKKGVGLAV